MNASNEKLVIGVGTSIVFDMSEADAVFRDACNKNGRAKGEAYYRDYMRERMDAPLEPGPGMDFIRAHLEHPGHELVVCSRNSALTALRAMRGFLKEGIIPDRLFFTNGGDIARYMRANEVDLFLSTNENDVKATLSSGVPAALITHRREGVELKDIVKAADSAPDATDALGKVSTALTAPTAQASFERNKDPITYVYDFDKVLAGSESDDYFEKNGLEAYKAFEAQNHQSPIAEGPLYALYKKQIGINASASGILPYRISIVTARGGLASFRALNTLAHWNLEPNGEFHFRNGASKQPVLQIIRENSPRGSIFFDDGDKNIAAAKAAAILAGKIPTIEIG